VCGAVSCPKTAWPRTTEARRGCARGPRRQRPARIVSSVVLVVGVAAQRPQHAMRGRGRLLADAPATAIRVHELAASALYSLFASWWLGMRLVVHFEAFVLFFVRPLTQRVAGCRPRCPSPCSRSRAAQSACSRPGRSQRRGT
jgi:hypothetical protein